MQEHIFHKYNIFENYRELLIHSMMTDCIQFNDESLKYLLN